MSSLWSEDGDPADLLSMVGGDDGKASPRKLRLFAAACCRSVWELLTDLGRHAVDVAEGFADGSTPLELISRIHLSAQEIYRRGRPHSRAEQLEAQEASVISSLTEEPFSFCYLGQDASDVVAYYASRSAVPTELWNTAKSDEIIEKVYADQTPRHCQLLRDIFTNPSRPLPPRRGAQLWKARWSELIASQGNRLPSLAQAAYSERHLPVGHLDTDRLAVLADALEDAGCDNTRILKHLRSPGPHVRGCWAVDLILVKS